MYCPNPLCQARNPVNQRSCQNCGTHIPYHYLWVGNFREIAPLAVNQLFDSRYLILENQVLLDTKPNQSGKFIQEMDEWAIRYAELFPYRQHVPQIYSYIEIIQSFQPLLENAPIYPKGATSQSGKDLSGQLMPELSIVWGMANLEQQINWMIQIYELWQPLGRLGLTETLLQSELVRVDGDTVKLLQLCLDQNSNPSLSDFAIIWGDLLNWEKSKFWLDLGQRMIQGQLVNSDQVLLALDQQMQMIQKPSGSSDFEVDLTTLTNIGPNRPENQDACYPPSETYLKQRSNQNPWLLVCDGVGGHEGGSLASKLAVSTVDQYLKSIDLTDFSESDIEVALEKAILMANSVICERNDRENRTGHQRMGTTAVLAYVQNHQLFITHVGDSRAYRITSTGCHQVTVDDDLASREAIYGSAFYREALQYPGTGSLTQALGMVDSMQLQPTTQRFWLIEPCIFLLCTDGLSDFDLIDRIWAQEIKPVFHDRSQLFPIAQRLIDIANEQNGHDNVTVGLINILKSVQTAPQTSIKSTQTAIAQSAPTQIRPKSTARPKTQLAPAPASSSWLKTALATLAVLGFLGGAGLAWWFQQQSRSRRSVPPQIASSPVNDDMATQLQKVNQILQVKPGPVPLALLPKPDLANAAPVKVGDLVPGTIVQVSDQLVSNAQETWVKFKICSIPADGGGAVPGPFLKPGTEGWQKLNQVTSQLTLPTSLPPSQLGSCLPPGTPPQLVPNATPDSTPSSTLSPLPQSSTPGQSPGSALPSAPNQAQ
jgi:protein phosphatase